MQYSKNMLTNSDLSKISKIVQEETYPIKKEVKFIRRDVTKMRKDIDVIISFFDRQYLDLERRLERLEEYLKLKPLSL